MDIKSIHQGLTTVGLLAEDCQQLARVCDLALEQLGLAEEGPEVVYVEALGAAFKAAGLAARAQLGYETS
jgi:hypothetical protein